MIGTALILDFLDFISNDSTLSMLSFLLIPVGTNTANRTLFQSHSKPFNTNNIG